MKLLNTAPLELRGDWGQSPAVAVTRVLSRTRYACLAGVKLSSDRQPDHLRVENRYGCYPSIWLHDDDPSMAWIIVNIEPYAWCQLAYQFGHELGHVLCNSWSRLSIPRAPCQWIEESLAEAFIIRGLALLAVNWKSDPPFEDDAAFANSIVKYRNNLISKYKGRRSVRISSWFKRNRSSLDRGGGESEAQGPATLAILRILETETRCVQDLGAINRWPERSGVPIEDYLTLWRASCADISAPGLLPKHLSDLFELN